jgi:hypothetical protein
MQLLFLSHAFAFGHVNETADFCGYFGIKTCIGILEWGTLRDSTFLLPVAGFSIF